MFWHCLGHAYGKYVEVICLKAPGNYSHQFWSNNVSVLLYEGPKPPTSIISGLASPWELLFMDLNLPKILHANKKKMWIF